MEYTVKEGDSLSKIAMKYGQSASNWEPLYALNQSVIGSNPNLIKPDQVLAIPAEWIDKQETKNALASVTSKAFTSTNDLIQKVFYRPDGSFSPLKTGVTVTALYFLFFSNTKTKVRRRTPLRRRRR